MSTHASTVFDAHAPDYDGLRRRLVPHYDALYGAAVESLELLGGSPKRVLDLGAGTGLLSAMVAAAHPGAELVLLDAAPAMLEEARVALNRAGRPVEIHVADMTEALPGGRFCAIVSALAIHHLEDEAKRDLFARAHDALSPGGLFVNAEQVRAPTPWLDACAEARHARRSAELGTTPQEWAAAKERMTFDRLATMEDQLGWLRDAGFSDVTARYQDPRFAVIVARRAPV